MCPYILGPNLMFTWKSCPSKLSDLGPIKIHISEMWTSFLTLSTSIGGFFVDQSISSPFSLIWFLMTCCSPSRPSGHLGIEAWIVHIIEWCWKGGVWCDGRCIPSSHPMFHAGRSVRVEWPPASVWCCTFGAPLQLPKSFKKPPLPLSDQKTFLSDRHRKGNVFFSDCRK